MQFFKKLMVGILLTILSISPIRSEIPLWLSGMESFLIHEPRFYLLNKIDKCVITVAFKPFSWVVPMLEGDVKKLATMGLIGATTGLGLYYVKSQYDRSNKNQQSNNASIIDSIMRDATSTLSKLEVNVKQNAQMCRTWYFTQDTKAIELINNFYKDRQTLIAAGHTGSMLATLRPSILNIATHLYGEALAERLIVPVA